MSLFICSFGIRTFTESKFNIYEITGNNNPPASWQADNHISNYIYFDFYKYISYPSMNYYQEDASGRHFFWNVLLKTMSS